MPGIICMPWNHMSVSMVACFSALELGSSNWAHPRLPVWRVLWFISALSVHETVSAKVLFSILDYYVISWLTRSTYCIRPSCGLLHGDSRHVSSQGNITLKKCMNSASYGSIHKPCLKELYLKGMYGPQLSSWVAELPDLTVDCQHFFKTIS